MKTKNLISGLVLGALGLATAGSAFAGAIIYNTGDESTASVALGINDSGSLNFVTPDSIVINSGLGATGLAYKFPDGYWRDGTSPGCLCEGWGVSATTGSGSVSGSANESFGGASNLTVDSFTTDADGFLGTGNYATSAVHLTSLPGLTVTQEYSVADVADTVLMKDVVTITNTTGGLLSDVRYVRVMDWDIPYTEFSEMVTIQGTATTTDLEKSHNNGFAVANPLIEYAQIASCGYDVDFTDCGSYDHGAYFRFNFGTLAVGESVEFTIFYGAAGTEAAADAAIAAEGIELYSYGQSDAGCSGCDYITGTPATYIFGFKGVGGVPQDPGVPEPASLILMGLGLVGIGALRRRRSSC